MNQPKRTALERVLYSGVILLWLSLSLPCYADALPAKFPNLDGTVWVGKDFDGKKYEITFHQRNGKPAPTTVPKQWIASGTATLVTDPDQKVKSCPYSLVGPTGNFAHHPGEDAPYYTIQFNWTGAPNNWPGSLRMEGMLWPDNYRITMQNVEPVVLSIDFKALFGNDYKGKQWYGEIVNCAGKDLPIDIQFCSDANSVREGFDGMLSSDGSVIMPGPKDLGETCYYQQYPRLVFVRKNVLVRISGLGAQTTPDVEKRMLEVAYLLDSAIHDDDPAVGIVSLPMILYPK